jgi:hypothetical protein
VNTLLVPTSEKVYSLASQTPFLSLASDDEHSTEEQVQLLLMRDLTRLGWRLRSNPNIPNTFEFAPPDTYDKRVTRQTMAYARNQIINDNKTWIETHLPLARKNLAHGHDVLSSSIIPRIEVCRTQESQNLFRIYRYYWSSPYSEYVGRRIRLLIRDDGIKGSPVIGIAALGSSIIHIPDRDNWIGWDTKTRTNRIVFIMDAYVLGALPPYNHLLGGKLIAYLLASNEVRRIFIQKYKNVTTTIKKRQANDMVLLVTTSLYGKNSSQYNRIKYENEFLYQPIGETTGFGTLHISSDTFKAMRNLLIELGKDVSYVFGDGANWRLRVIKRACELMGMDSETILNHSFKRGLFAVPLAHNWKEFLNDVDSRPNYRDLPMKKLVECWKNRWFEMRKRNELVVQMVKDFSPNSFSIEQLQLEVE